MACHIATVAGRKCLHSHSSMWLRCKWWYINYYYEKLEENPSDLYWEWLRLGLKTQFTPRVCLNFSIEFLASSLNGCLNFCSIWCWLSAFCGHTKFLTAWCVHMSRNTVRAELEFNWWCHAEITLVAFLSAAQVHHLWVMHIVLE